MICSKMKQLIPWIMLAIVGTVLYGAFQYGSVISEYMKIKAEMDETATLCSKYKTQDCLRTARGRTTQILGFEPTLGMSISDVDLATVTCEYDREVSFLGKRRVHHIVVEVKGRHDRSQSGVTTGNP